MTMFADILFQNPATRRPATRSRNDENAAPQPSIRNKPSLSHLGPAQKTAVSGASAAAAGKKPVAAKVGAKRTALGGVAVNAKEDGVEGKKPLKATAGKTVAEVRQPLASRNNDAQSARPIAAIPSRSKTSAPIYSSLDSKLSLEDDFQMEGDFRRQQTLSVPQGIDTVEEEYLDEDSEEDDMEEEDEEDWLRMPEEDAIRAQEQLDVIQATFKDEVDLFDTTMVAEYADEIFGHMEMLEESVMPNPRYMDFQTEIEWTMRTTLIDWLLQVHLRYHMLPETLWIAVNIVDRFLSVRVVSLVKLQLVGVTAMFIAAKYEEILAPSVDEFVYMTENGYTKDEILKGERIILQTLDFTVSSYCSPYSWVRRISKADDYDVQTRTLSKFLMEVTLLDHRFLRCKPSMIAAIGMYLARKMLGGDWNDAFVFYSNFTESQLITGASLLCERLVEPDFESVYVYKKYANKKFLRASTFARDWALNNTS
ncbi:cyclin [Cryptococcus wingfieldii CBS 7118]|uniref:Cyclin n=1 Tax=Cryptococcus wingfieldii CBS 7118 TaxID=1295528 RepID=A0A1E3IW07_9TREE|nr:cyclin [Cryptococcus wingfieldii CBS 7118]ODN92804.1 cyclin [Cryptococcus wingfieldii CBS 7118]